MVRVELAHTEEQALAAHAILQENAEMVGFVTRGSVVAKMLAHRLAIAMSDTHEVIGCVCFGVRRERTAVIYEIATTRAAAGQGVGAQMIAWLKKDFAGRGIFAIKLKCTSDNVGANKFYEKVGFKLAGEERGRKRSLMVWRMELGGGFTGK